MGKKYFGTDGIRGLVGQHPITAEFMLHLGWAAGRVFAKQGFSKILIGKDTRISGYMFESALEAGIIAAGVDVSLLGPMPTPAIAYLTRTFHAQAGIVISASHNPFYDNGIKFFSSQGTKLPDELELAIEAELEQVIETVDSSKLGKATRISDASGRYIEYCKSTIPTRIDLNGLNIALDCANGATYQVAPAVFQELGATIHPIGVDPDGLNINDKFGSTQPEALQRLVVENKYDFGIAFDGDGDRLMMVDHTGELVDGDELVYIIARDRQIKNNMPGGVVGTLMSNLGMELALQAAGIPFSRSQVGDRYVLEQMIANDWMLGGESSGHIICRDRTTTGDGIIAALQVMAAVYDQEKSLKDLKMGMTKLPQTMVNVRLSERCDPTTQEDVKNAIGAIENRLGDSGRILLRLSGTEPLVRVMVEGEDRELVSELANDLAQTVQRAIG